MTLSELIMLLENKVVKLSQLKSNAANVGDVEQVIVLEDQEAETQTLLSQLKQITQSN